MILWMTADGQILTRVKQKQYWNIVPYLSSLNTFKYANNIHPDMSIGP